MGDLLDLPRQLRIFQNDSDFDPTNPAFGALVEQILFSRRFILTYYIVLGVALGLYSCLRWIRKRKKPRWHNISNDQSSHRSSTDTLRSKTSEATPLLASDKSQTEFPHNTSLVRSICRHVQAWLITQPSPIPALTAPANRLPSNQTSAAVSLLLALNVFYLFYHVPLSIPMLFAFADRAGLCFVVNLPLLYLIAAKSNQPLKVFTGWSYEGLNLFHRRLGEWMTVLAAVHGVCMFGVWYTLLRPLHFTLVRFLTSKLVLLGILALVAYLAIYVTSIGWVRRLYYETFLGLHIVLQVAALAFLFFHHPNGRPYVLVSMTIWVLDRLVLRGVVSSTELIATLEIADDQHTVVLFCDVPISRSKYPWQMSICNGWKPGHHVFVSVPALGRKHRFQTHPFTIASPAPPPSFREDKWPLQLIIRAQDGFSKDLLAHSKFHQHVRVCLNGPYGSTEALEALRNADRSCLIAGGSGIAVTYPLAWDLLTNPTEDSLFVNRVMYQRGVRVVPCIDGWEESPQSKRCVHLWMRQDRSHDSWIKILPRRHGGVADTSIVQPKELFTCDLVSLRFETRGRLPVSARPDIKNELQEWAMGQTCGQNNLHLRHTLVVVVSGPDSLVRDVRHGAASLLRAGHNIEVYVEKFGW